jgi:hypothetical protein
VLDMVDVSCYSPTVNLSWDFHFVDDTWRGREEDGNPGCNCMNSVTSLAISFSR